MDNSMRIGGRVVEKEQPIPEIHYALCNGCGECVTVCPDSILVMQGEPKKPHFQSKIECSYCGLCEQVCTSGAIYLTYEIYFVV
jgi:Pyruvate/2-oxoacid:ferredoxin oxidoreductase delta subunit